MADIKEILKAGGVGVMPTDTLYGIVGPALDRRAVRRIYRLRRRNPRKPMIILIGSIRDLRKFGVIVDPASRKILAKVWPGKVSVVLEIVKSDKRHETRKKFLYLHRGTNTLALRLPKLKWLREFLEETGPLVAPSANFEGEPPAKNIKEAKKYFGKQVDFYMDKGEKNLKPSTLIKIEKGKAIVLRKGAMKIV
jgi:L-threonylcarbamoyladenylate synthase